MEKQGIFIHALHKSASMFLLKLLRVVTERNHYVHYALNNPPGNITKLKPWQYKRFCAGPIRDFEPTKTPFPFIKNKTHIYHIRDPRDILVSQYFSFGWIHGHKQWDAGKLKERDYIQSVSIDEYALSRAVSEDLGSRPALKKRFSYLENYQFTDNQHIIIHYEEMVLHFRKWLENLLAPFDIPDQQKEVDFLYEMYHREFITDGKDKKNHKRKMIPGDYLEKLKPDTIEQLNVIFEPELELFNYKK